MRTIRCTLPLALLSVLVFCLPLSAQTWNPKTLVFTGTSYDSAALTQLAAISVSKPVTTKQIEDAMARMDDTGLFSDIHYTVDSNALTFKLVPATKMLPIIYGNFLLWQPDELTAAVKQRVPLFNGRLPTSGSFQQTVGDALTAVLLDKGVKAHVESLLSQDGSVVYSITDPRVQIRQVHVEAVAPQASAKVAEVLLSFANTDYDRNSSAAIAKRLVDTYLDLGYLDVTADPPVRSAPVIEPTRIYVDYTAVTHEGSVYRVTALEWPVTPIVPQADFAKAVSIKVGDPAARIELLSAAARAQAQFAAHGYLDARVTPHEQKDAYAHTIAYSFTADLGEVYHLKAYTIAGLNDRQRDDLTAACRFPEGTVFDQAISRCVTGWTAKNAPGAGPHLTMARDHADHTVLLTITFAHGAATR